MARTALVCALCILALGIRLVFLYPPVLLDTKDGRLRYDPQARNLLGGHGFSISLQAPYLPDTFEHNPGYAPFLAALYFIGNYNLEFVALIQTILELFTAYLVWLITGLLGLSKQTRWLAVIIGLLCPLIARFNREILTEVLATFSITLALYCLLLAMKNKRSVSWIIAGLSFGLVLLVRADQLPVILLLICTSAILSREIVKSFLLVVALLLTLTPWTLRNYQITGRFLPLGAVVEQSSSPYLQWLSTWITDLKDHDLYWHKLKPDPKVDYASLAAAAKQKNPIDVYLTVPLVRVFNVWVRDLDQALPKGHKWIPLHLLAYGSVLLAVLGVFLTLYQRMSIMLVPFSILLGRSSLPWISAAAMHSRLLLEAMPVVFIFAGIAVDMIFRSPMEAGLNRDRR